jgi:mannosyltransferase
VTSPRVAALRLAAGPALLTLAICLVGIGARQLWRDEHATWWAATLPLGDLRRLVAEVDIVLLPYYLFLHLWIEVFGTSEVALRLPSALFMAAAAGLLTLVGRRLLDAPAGLLAGLIFAVVPIVSRYGQEARPYAMALAATLAATLLLLRALDEPSVPRWIGYGVAVFWIGCSHLVALSVLAAHLVLVLAARDRGRRVLIGWPVAVTAAVLLVSPVVFLGRSQAAQIAWIDEPTWDMVSALPGEVFVSTPVAAVVLILALVGIGLLAAAGGRQRWVAAALATWLLLPPLATYLTFDKLGLFHHRYLLLVSLAATLAAAWTVRRLGVPPPMLIVAGLVAVLTVGAAGLPRQLFVRSDGVENELGFAAAARHVHDNAQPGDRIAYVGYVRLHRGFSYEFSRLPGPDPDEVYSGGNRERPWWWDHRWPREPGEAFDGVQRFWLVVTGRGGNPYSRMPAPTRRLLERQYTITNTTTFQGLQVTLFTQRS